MLTSYDFAHVWCLETVSNHCQLQSTNYEDDLGRGIPAPATENTKDCCAAQLIHHFGSRVERQVWLTLGAMEIAAPGLRTECPC